jgi:hypothetical protein
MMPKNRCNWKAEESQIWVSIALERCVSNMDNGMEPVLQGIYESKTVAFACKLSDK